MGSIRKLFADADCGGATPAYNRFKPSSGKAVNLGYMINIEEVFKVSDTDFSVHASYMITFFWEDDRIFVDDPEPLTYYTLDTSLFDKFWSPRNKVAIRHAKESRQNAGLVFHKTSFGLSRLAEGGNWTFDVVT